MFYNLQNSSKLFNKKREPILNVLHLESDKERNEKLIIPILAILVAFFEQVSAERNVYITVIVLHFMFGMMQLSAKTPKSR
jgi:hypothetical protein